MFKFRKNQRKYFRSVLVKYPKILIMVNKNLHCVVCNQVLICKRETVQSCVETHIHNLTHISNARKARRISCSTLTDELQLEDKIPDPLIKEIKMERAVSIENDDVFHEQKPDKCDRQESWSLSTINPATPVYTTRGPHPWSIRESSGNNLTTIYPGDFQKHIHKMRNIVCGHYIWFSIDERRDEKQLIEISFMFGVLNESQRQERYLFSKELLNKADAGLIGELFDLNIDVLGVDRQKVLLVITNCSVDTTQAFQKKAKVYPKLIHINSLQQSFAQMDEFIHRSFQNVHHLIVHVYELFLQWPHLYTIFKTNFLPTSASAPPSPKPGSWTETAIFFGRYFKEIKAFVGSLPQYSAEIAVIKAKNAVQQKQIYDDLLYVTANFQCLIKSLAEMKTPGQSLWTSYNHFNAVLVKLDSLKDPKYAAEMRNILTNNNKHMEDILEIVLVLSEKLNNCKFIYTTSKGHTKEELKALSLIPLVGCEASKCTSGLIKGDSSF